MLVVVLMLIGVVAVPAAYVISRSQGQRRERLLLNPANRQKRVRETTQALRLPYRYADDQLFISGNAVWTGVKLAGTTDEYLTDEEKADAAAAVAGTYNALLAVFDGQPVHCHEVIRYRPSSAEQWARMYMRSLWHPTRLFRQLIGQVSALLEESTPERVRFLMVRLGDFTAESVPDPLSAIASTISGVADEHFRRADLEPFRDRAERVHGQLAVFNATPMTRGDLIWLIRKTVSGHRFPAEEPILSSKPVRNGFFDMALNVHGRNGHDYLELFDSDPDTGATRSSFTATLVVAEAPAETEFNPAYSWGPLLARHARQVELSWRYELIPAELFKDRAVEVANNIKDEAQDRLKGRAGRDSFFASKDERADTLLEDTGRNPQPAMIGRLRLVLSAPSPRELAMAEREVRAVMGEIVMVRPPRVQRPLLMEQFPGDFTGRIIGGLVAARGGGVAIGERTTDLWAPAVARLDSEIRVGDSISMHKGRPRGTRGFPIGWTYAHGLPVHFMAHSQVARDRGPGIGVIGASGSGKSTWALLTFFWESESGVQCVALDPKNDFEKFCYYLAFGHQVMHPDFQAEAQAGTLGLEGSRFQPVNKQFWADTTIVNLTRGVAGQLDAWSIHGNYAEAEELARGQLEILFPHAEDRAIVEQGLVAMREHWERQQAGTLIDGEPITPCLGAVVEFIGAARAEYQAIWDDNRGVAEKKELERFDRVLDRFKRAATTQYAKLMIGDGTRVDLGDMSRRRVVFTLHGFKPPVSQDPAHWSEGESNAAACMFTALTLVNALFDDSMRPNPVTGRPGVPPRSLFVDEAYMIARLPRGQAVISICLRQGRSLKLTVFVLSQQAFDIQMLEQLARDAGDVDVNQFGTVLVFQQKSLAEALQALALLRDTGTTDRDQVPAEIRALARNLREEGPAGGLLRGGVCVMRDADGRVATVAVDQMFHELARATETNATERPTAQSFPISSDGREWELDPTTMLEVRTGVISSVDASAASGGDIDYDAEWLAFADRGEHSSEESDPVVLPVPGDEMSGSEVDW
ncbi:ATP-binding protein [Nocardia sp. NPDC052566]|uniref:ATP-binding protein n=1 Tax=Nocardia sp. NPDC052566 TaxID=3364330 RepID=UPI0037C75CDA